MGLAVSSRTATSRSTVTNSGRNLSWKARYRCYKVTGRLRLKEVGSSVTVGRDMPSSRPTRRRRVERREVRAARRARNFALLLVLAIVLVVALLLTAFGGGAARMTPLAVTGLGANAQTRPSPQVVAVRGAVRLQMPVAQNAVTAIGYHAARRRGDDGSRRSDGRATRVSSSACSTRSSAAAAAIRPGTSSAAAPTSALDVGAAPGTGVYSPVDGTVVGISPYVVGGHHYGARIDIQPQNAPSLVVSLTQLNADPSLYVGANVIGGATRLGSVVNLAPHREAGARPVHERRRQPRHGRAPARGDAGPELRLLFLADVFGRRGAARRRGAAARPARRARRRPLHRQRREHRGRRRDHGEARRQAARRRRRRRHARQPHVPPRGDRRVPRRERARDPAGERGRVDAGPRAHRRRGAQRRQRRRDQPARLPLPRHAGEPVGDRGRARRRGAARPRRSSSSTSTRRRRARRSRWRRGSTDG